MGNSIVRIQSVDSIRLLAIISVIALHTTPFASNSYHVYIIIIQFARFAVPFFFVVSGYFWGLKIRGQPTPLIVTKNMAFRIGLIFLAWSFIYLLPFNNISAFFEYGMLGPLKMAYWKLTNLLQEPSNLLFQGTSVHLWFLMGLLYALFISFIFIQRKAEKELLVFASILYIIGVLLKSYADTPLGFHVEFNTRNGPFFSTLLFSSGYFLSQRMPNEKWFIYGIGLFFMGCLIHFVEIYLLMILYGTDLSHDYVFGTYLMGVGAAMLSLSNHKILQIRFFRNTGKMTLGIYAIHVIFVGLLSPVDKITNSPLWEVGFVVVVLVLSILSTHALSKIPILRRIVL